MPHKLSWYVENRIIHIYLYGDLADDEFTRVGDAMYDFVEAAIPPMFLLVDVREVTKMPTSISRISSDLARFRNDTRHTWTIVLSNSTLFNFIGMVASKVVGVPMRSFNTLEEAHAFIIHNAPDLSPALESISAH